MQLSHEKNAGSIVAGRPHGGLIQKLSGRSVVDKLVREAKDVDIYLVASGEEA